MRAGLAARSLCLARLLASGKALCRRLHVLRLGEHNLRRLRDEVHVDTAISADIAKLIGARLQATNALGEAQLLVHRVGECCWLLSSTSRPLPPARYLPRRGAKRGVIGGGPNENAVILPRAKGALTPRCVVALD